MSNRTLLEAIGIPRIELMGDWKGEHFQERIPLYLDLTNGEESTFPESVEFLHFDQKIKDTEKRRKVTTQLRVTNKVGKSIQIEKHMGLQIPWA